MGDGATFSDAELAQLDVAELLRAGGPELEGEGAVAAAIQLAEDGTSAGDVFMSAQEVRAGDVMAGEPPSRLDTFVAAGREVGDEERLATWLERVADLMTMRGA